MLYWLITILWIENATSSAPLASHCEQNWNLLAAHQKFRCSRICIKHKMNWKEGKQPPSFPMLFSSFKVSVCQLCYIDSKHLNAEHTVFQGFWMIRKHGSWHVSLEVSPGIFKGACSQESRHRTAVAECEHLASLFTSPGSSLNIEKVLIRTIQGITV